MMSLTISINDVLKAAPLFAGLPAADIAKIAGSVEIVERGVEDTIFVKGEAAAYCYILISGEVQLSTGDAPVCLMTGRVFGEEAVNLDTYLTTATATSNVVLFRINKESLNVVKAQSPWFATHAGLLLVERFSGKELALVKPAKKKIAAELTSKEKLGWLLTTIAPVVLYFVAESYGFTNYASIFIGIIAAVILMWAFSIVDEFVPPVIAVVASIFIGLAPPSVALSGFSTPTLLTLLGVYALAASVMQSGLSYRVVLMLLKALPSNAFSNQFVLLISGYLLSFVTPSGNNRISLLLPVYKDMVSSLKLKKQGNAATALMAATFGGAMLFSPMLAISKSANITAVSFLPDSIQEKFLGFYWLYAALFCVIGVTLLHMISIRRVFPAQAEKVVDQHVVARQLDCLGAIKPAEKFAAFGFFAFIFLCVTYSIHHIEPSIVSGLILIMLLLFGVYSKVDFKNQTDWPMVFFLLGIDSLMNIMNYLGLDKSLAAALHNVYNFIDGRLWLFMGAACITTLIIRLALPLTAGMLAACVILLPVANQQGIHPWICVFLCAIFSDIWFFPYQSSVYLQVKSSVPASFYDEGGFFRYNMWVNIGRIFVVFASIPWWIFLGLA